MIGRIIFVVCLLAVAHHCCRSSTRDLAALKKDESVGGLRCANLYADAEGHIVGAKFWDVRSGAPIYLLQIETVPQVFMWVDTPADSNKGVAHALEHLLGGKGTKGRYVSLLKEMRLSRSVAATTDDFNLYSFSSGTGLDGFFEQFHAWLDTLYRPDFTDFEAEREFYHFGILVDPATKKKTLVEKGSVYDEMQAGQGIYQYYFELNKRVFGPNNPFGFYNSGVPDEMRHVIPADIRRFHHEHYRLGPTTGFIFALSPKEDAFSFLHRISQEVDQFTDSDAHLQIHKEVIKPKYSTRPPLNKKIALFPFPSNSESDRGEVRFGWAPVKTESQVDLRLLQLFFRALADGELKAAQLFQSTLVADINSVRHLTVLFANSAEATSITLGPSILSDIQQQLLTSGLPQEEQSILSQLGFTPDEIAGIAPATAAVMTFIPTNWQSALVSGTDALASQMLSVSDWIDQRARALEVPQWSAQEITGTPPSGRGFHGASAVYDPSSKRMILFAGRTSNGANQNDVWVLTNANGQGWHAAVDQFSSS